MSTDAVVPVCCHDNWFKFEMRDAIKMARWEQTANPIQIKDTRELANRLGEFIRFAIRKSASPATICANQRLVVRCGANCNSVDRL
eukprot:scaffold9948_cov129-Skeletonema_dohrnii-CCMP3373.AAC.6